MGCSHSKRQASSKPQQVNDAGGHHQGATNNDRMRETEVYFCYSDSSIDDTKTVSFDLNSSFDDDEDIISIYGEEDVPLFCEESASAFAVRTSVSLPSSPTFLSTQTSSTDFPRRSN
ncbi:uncharacterized protein LOC112128247 isoform X1 [Cimex lectularius]|uniref:Uncharacterized protein n=1 Tax=Cimex lectularius TaxID=79782 RepID=A0A8I6SRD2_CIMLE|nr:uncharacterized protein LOC112128247 isoform X1 [Cimex lectularius]XP_024085950.1 uncharacterized protein LOC112128247 isoform X1 [Cimex lectularius]XP_024085951.1 uncharacterized protein LOC112128247 isoform X1 [Cimex lectularius]